MSCNGICNTGTSLGTTFRQNGFIRQLISYNNVFQVQCQNAKMYKNRYRNLDKIPVLHFDQ